MGAGTDWENQPLWSFTDDLARYERVFEESNRLGLRSETEQTISFSLHLSNTTAVPGTVSRR
jgi:hypothetical protein